MGGMRLLRNACMSSYVHIFYSTIPIVETDLTESYRSCCQTYKAPVATVAGHGISKILYKTFNNLFNLGPLICSKTFSYYSVEDALSMMMHPIKIVPFYFECCQFAFIVEFVPKSAKNWERKWRFIIHCVSRK